MSRLDRKEALFPLLSAPNNRGENIRMIAQNREPRRDAAAVKEPRLEMK